MSESNPHFTYSPEGILTIGIELTDDPYRSTQLELVNELDTLKGIEAVGVGQIEVDIKRAFQDELKLGSTADKTAKFIKTIQSLIPHSPNNLNDKFSYLQWVSNRGLTAGVYPSFQAMLNNNDLLEESFAKQILQNMAIPFGKDYEKRVLKDFRMASNGAEALHYSYSIFSDDFSFYRSRSNETEYIEQNGTVKWNWLNISTLGSCACLGVNGDDRRGISLDLFEYRPWLYEMKPHNIDVPIQTLSFMLALGTFAYKSIQSTDSNDIYADVEWGNERTYPKVIENN